MSFINKMNIGNVSYDIQAGEKVQLTFPAGTTKGTLTEEQLAKLQANYQSCIEMVNDKELYYLNDPGHVEGYLTYSHVGIENSKATIKTLTITVSAKSFVIVTTVVPTESGGGGKLYLHKVNLTGTYLIDIYSSYSTTFTYESFVAYLNKIARVIPCYIWADDGRAKYQLTRVGYISSAGIYTGWYDGNEYNDVYTYSIESDTVTEL